MSSEHFKQGFRPAALLLPFLLGALGIIVLFAAGSRSGSGNYAIFATCVWFLFGAGWLSKRIPSGRLFIGILMNLPLWLSLIFLTEAGPFQDFVWGLVLCLGAAYLGVFLGQWWSTLPPRIHRRVFALSLSVALVLLVSFFFVVRLPTPIRGDKQVFVGHWKSASGFALQIESDGTARILNNRSGGQDIKIEVGPNTIDRLHVHFVGDTILNVLRPSYYGKTYRIDRYPYPDSSAFVMILNGTTFLRE